MTDAKIIRFFQNKDTGQDTDILGQSSAYNIDIAPHVLYGAGPLIKLLLGCGAHEYTEYKLIQGNFIGISNHTKEHHQPMDIAFDQVPSTRAEIFRSTSLSLLEKRSLMRFLKACTEAILNLENDTELSESTTSDDDPALVASHQHKTRTAPLQPDDDDGSIPLKDLYMTSTTTPFSRVLSSPNFRLNENLQRCIMHGALLQHTLHGDDMFSCYDALCMLRLYMDSLGRYGTDAGPFLTPMYGCGELPQAFCRIAAVHGAVQVLRCPVALENDAPIQNDFGDTCQQQQTISVSIYHTDESHSESIHHARTAQTLRCKKLVYGDCYRTGAVGTITQPPQLTTASSDAAPAVASPAMHAHGTALSLCRCVAIVDAPLQLHGARPALASTSSSYSHIHADAMRHDQQSIFSIVLDEKDETAVVWGLFVGHSTCVSPRGRWLVHLWKVGKEREIAYDVLHPVLQSIVDCSSTGGIDIATSTSSTDAFTGRSTAARKPRALFAAYFMLHTRDVDEKKSKNTVYCPGPRGDVTFAKAVETAKRLYWSLFPEDDSISKQKANPVQFPLDTRADRAREPDLSAHDVKDEHSNVENDGGEMQEEQKEDKEDVQYSSDDEAAIQALQEALHIR